MQKKLSIVFIISLLFFGCASNDSGGIPTSLIDGATAVDTDISDLQDGQTDSAVIAQEITDTSGKITESISTVIGQLSGGEEADSEFARIVNKIQERESVDFVETNNNDIGQGSADTTTQEPAE